MRKAGQMFLGRTLLSGEEGSCHPMGVCDRIIFSSAYRMQFGSGISVFHKLKGNLAGILLSKIMLHAAVCDASHGRGRCSKGRVEFMLTFSAAASGLKGPAAESGLVISLSEGSPASNHRSENCCSAVSQSFTMGLSLLLKALQLAQTRLTSSTTSSAQHKK